MGKTDGYVKTPPNYSQKERSARHMKLSVVILGILLILAGLSLIIISANEIQFLNTCTSRFFCLSDNFFGHTTPESIYAAAYAFIEVGTLITVAGAIITLIGARAQHPA